MAKRSVFFLQAPTRAVDLLSDLEGSIWVAWSWFSFSFASTERTETRQQSAFRFVRFGRLLMFSQVVDDDRDARRSIKEVLKTYSKAMLLRIWQMHDKQRGQRWWATMNTMRIKQNMPDDLLMCVIVCL